VGAKVDPVGNRRTDGDGTTFNTDEETPVAGLGTLGLICGNGRSGTVSDDCVS
jgi:hypothetical protein